MPQCDNSHPDHTKMLHRLNRVSGQVEGIRRMIEERRYCPDIMIQIDAARTALASIQDELLEVHLADCVADAFATRDREVAKEKTQELLTLFRRRRK